MLNRIIPNFEDEQEFLTKTCPAGWVLGLDFSFTKPEYMINRYPSDWVRYYEHNNLMFEDPVAQFSLAGDGMKRWSDFVLNPRQQHLMEMAAHHGLKYGVAMSVRDQKHASFLTIAHNQREFTDDEMNEIYGRFRIWDALALKPIEFSKNEIEVLKHFRDGLGRKEVAEEMNLSETTVKRLLTSAILRTGCKSKTEAVAYASWRRII